MAGSSMRNSLHRRNHKERAQPAHRAKLGLLEKHKDYVHRARDYAAKRERLKRLREKVAFRNKDEFYWGMVKARTEQGVHQQGRGNEPLPAEVVRLLKTQDAGYIRTQVSVEMSKITAVKEQLHALADLVRVSSPSDDMSDFGSDAGEDDGVDLETLRFAGVIPPAPDAASAKRKGKARASLAPPIPARGHTIFVDSREELQKYGAVDSLSDDGTSSVASSSKLPAEDSGLSAAAEPMDMGYILPKGKKTRKEKTQSDVDAEQAQREIELDEQEQVLAEEAKLHRRALMAELSARINRLAQLRAVEAHMTQQRAMMGRGSKKIKSRAEKIVDEDSGDEGGNGASRKVSWRPKVVKWKAERKR